MSVPSRAVVRGYLACERVTRFHARTFYLASVALGPRRRYGAFAVYAFCRRVDDAIDGAAGQPRAQLTAEILALRAMLDVVYSDRAVDDGALLALRDTVRAFGIERRPFDELIDGVALDVGTVRVADDAELDRYCYLVAGTVGLMMARLFGVEGEHALPHAIDLGKAMQLTNILRDVREDHATLGRVYLPATRLAAHGLTANDLAKPSAPPALRALVRDLAGEARALYRSAERGVPMITSRSGRAATAIMARSYGAILDVLEARDWDVLAGRARVSGPRKLVLLTTTLTSGAWRTGGT